MFSSIQLPALLTSLLLVTPVTLVVAFEEFDLNDYHIEAGNTTFIPLNISDPSHWGPAHIYEGLPVVTKIEANSFKYDIDIANLTLAEFSDIFLVGETWENFTYTEEAIEEQRSILLGTWQESPAAAALRAQSEAEDARMAARSLTERYIPYAPTCASSRVVYKTINSNIKVNKNVWGAYHYESEKLCGPVSGAYTKSVTHVSGVTVSGTFTPLSFGKGVVKTLSTFLTAFGISISGPSPDSVSVGHTYSVACPDRTVCFLYERPHLAVHTGHTQAFAWDGIYGTVRCPRLDHAWDWSLHVVYPEGSGTVAASWGMCYSKNGHGCGWGPKGVASNLYCPNPNM